MDGDENPIAHIDEALITLNPDATSKEIDEFLDEYARAILAISRHVVDKEERGRGSGDLTDRE